MTDFHGDELTTGFMDLKPLAIVAGVLAVFLCLAFSMGYGMGQRKQIQRATQAEKQADEAKGKADALKAVAIQKDQALDAGEARLAESRAKMDRITAELSRLRASQASAQASSNREASDFDPVPGPVADLAPVVAKQDELIKAQADVIQAQDVKISGLILSRDAWKGSAGARESEAIQLRAALTAQQGLNAGALWRGRIQGFAVGIASGYVAGRLK